MKRLTVWLYASGGTRTQVGGSGPTLCLHISGVEE